MDMMKNRRTRLVINKPVQSRIMLSVSWPPLICMLVTGLTLMTFCVKLSYEAMQVDVELPSVVPVCVSAITFMIIGSVYFMFLVLKFSHRIAGPMYRIQKTLEAWRAGNTTIRANLRKGDHLTELATAVNGFLDWLEQHPPAGMTTAAPAEATTTPAAATATATAPAPAPDELAPTPH
jgi:hypothetical protein